MPRTTVNPTISFEPHFLQQFYLEDGTAIFACIGNPEGLVFANQRSLAISNNNTVYLKTTDNAATGWVALAGGGGGGTVTSVGLSMPGIFSVSGSPVTGAGTLTASLVNQNANTVWAGPSSGIPAAPAFRSLVAADLALGASPPSGGIQFNDGTNAFIAENDFLFDAASGTMQIGLAGSRAGKIQIRGAVSGSVTLTVDQPSSNHTLQFPNALPATNDLFRAASVSGTNIVGGWVAPSGLGFPTINATDGALPYRSSASAFSDSPLRRLSTTGVGFEGATSSFAALKSSTAGFIGQPGIGSVDGGESTMRYLGCNNLVTTNIFSNIGSPTGCRLGGNLEVVSGFHIIWSSNASNALGTSDAGFVRLGTNTIRVSNGGTGAGQFVIGSSVASTSHQFLVDSQSTSRIAGYFTMPGSSTVATIKGEISAIQSFAFYPSGKIQGGANAPTSNQQWSAIGNAKSDVSSIGNVGTGVDNLLSFAIVANSLNNTGDYCEFDAFGEFENNANNKNLSIVFGATTIFTTGALPFGVAALANWRINAKIVRTAASGQKCIVTFQCNDGTTKFLQTITTSAEDLTANKTVQFTGEATTTNDIEQLYLESKICVAQTS